MHRYTTAELRQYANNAEAAVTTKTDDPDGPVLNINLADPTQRVIFCIYAWVIGELANIREQLDRIEAKLDETKIILAPEGSTPLQIKELNEYWTTLPLIYTEGDTHDN